MNTCSNQYNILKELNQLHAVIDSAIAFIELNSIKNLSPEFILRIKWILTELCSNTYKHSSSSNALLEILIQQEQIILRVSDKGNVFDITQFINTGMQSFANGIHKIRLCDYGFLSLHAQFSEQCHLLFSTEEANNNINIESLNEHYGLLIITRACDEFTYTYHEHTNTNEFNAILKY